MGQIKRSRLRAFFGIAIVNIIVVIAIFLLTELILHLAWKGANPLLALGKNELRIQDPVYTHTLKPNFEGYDAWGANQALTRTNSLGFKDASTRNVPSASDRKRVVFIGDSFTEALGVSYEQSFVGLFAKAFPDLDVLNAGVSSYSPSVYYEKLKYYLNAGLKFDEAIVYIDISDIQDEALMYFYDESGRLQIRQFKDWPDGCSPLPRPLVRPANRTWFENHFYTAEFLWQRSYARALKAENDRASLHELSQQGAAYSWDYGRGSWTYNKDAACYGALGIEGAIEKAKGQMDRLYKLLSDRGIALSVGVYPWPQQLLHDKENSRQAQIWREWCAGKCRRFFDHFPAFFRYKEKDPQFLKDLFFWGDMHFNARGNELLAGGLIEKYRQ